MKCCCYILFFLGFAISLKGQTETVVVNGTVSYVSSRNVYVKFVSTDNINIGDTLFLKKNEVLIPALEIHSKSSTSTVCISLLSEKRKIGDELFAKTISIKEIPKAKEEKEEETKTVKEEMDADEKVIQIEEELEKELVYKEKIKGRISAASYSSLSDYKNRHRMRYAFSFRGDYLKNSKWSVDSYINFRHTLGEWEEVKENLARALKVYSFAIKYDFDLSTKITLGRKINHRISSMGAIDGLQFEKNLGQILLGGIVGSRPDYSDYNLNVNLFQTGAYVGYVSKNPKKYQQSTLGFIEQRNHGKVDRRFAYFQYSGRVLKNLNLFSSFEADLFENINSEVKNTLRLTNFYVSLRYRLSKKIRLSGSYDKRKNVIYYETYKSFIERLIENETRQGLRFGMSYRPFRYISWGMNSSLRFQKNNGNTSRNLNTYINVSRIPYLKTRATFRANFLETNYLNSRTYAIRLSKTLIKKKLNGDLYYRRVNYQYKNQDYTILQNVAGVNFSWKLMRKLTLYAYYEGTFNNQNKKYHRINTKLIKRF